MKTTSPYKTAEELGIEQWEHDGLVALIGPLSRGELVIDMRNPIHNCGTACCIGGYLHAFTGKRPFELGIWWGCARPLYYPSGDTGAGWDGNALQAARAIVNFLTLGDPRWDDVMREPA